MAIKGTIKKCGCDCATPYDPCGCSAGPSCAIECQRDATGYRCSEAGCPGIPFSDTECYSEYRAASECVEGAGDCPAYVVPAQVRVTADGLVGGHTYRIRVNFISDISSTSYVEWTITPPGTPATTSWQDFPTPDATDQIWNLDGACIIEDIT